jgi:hypothetical protein
MISSINNGVNPYATHISNNNSRTTESTAPQAANPSVEAAQINISDEGRQLATGIINNIRPSTITEGVWNAMSQENRAHLLNSQEQLQHAFANQPMMNAASLAMEHFRLTQALHIHYDPEARQAREAGDLVVNGRLAEEVERLATGRGSAVTLPEVLPETLPENTITPPPNMPDFEVVNQTQAQLFDLFNSLNNAETQADNVANNSIMQILSTHNLT